MVHVLFSQCEDLDIEVRQMKLTCCVNDTLIHLPDLLDDILFFSASLSDKSPTLREEDALKNQQPEHLDSPASSFLDVVVAFTCCNLAHSRAENHALFKADSFKVTIF